MAGEWKRVRVNEIAQRTATGPFGSAISSKHFCDSGVPVIRGSNLSQETGIRLVDEGLTFVSEEKAREFARSEARPGDLVFTCWGTIDQVGLIDHRARYKRYIVSNKQMLFTPDASRADSLFLYYTFRSPENRSAILNQGIGSSVPGFNLGQLRSFEIDLPPLANQKAIAAVLGALDDKIELNRRMNATLDAMVRVLFQSWFVDFDPVRAKLDGRKPDGLDKPTAALFPAAFQDSNLGPIPKGWTVSNIADLATRIAMGPFGSRITRDNFVPDGVPVVRGGNLTDGFVDDDFVFLTEAKADELKASVASSLDLVFTHRGTLGQVGIVPANPRYPRYVVSQSQMLLSVDKGKASPWMVYLFFRSPIGEAALLANTSTTGVPAISRPTTSLKAIPMVLPPTAVGKRYDEVVQPLFLQREQSARHSRTLTTLRDTLLPKLLSGQLSVANLEQIRETIAQ